MMRTGATITITTPSAPTPAVERRPRSTTLASQVLRASKGHAHPAESQPGKLIP